jgi:hypothetical protein
MLDVNAGGRRIFAAAKMAYLSDDEAFARVGTPLFPAGLKEQTTATVTERVPLGLQSI